MQVEEEEKLVRPIFIGNDKLQDFHQSTNWDVDRAERGKILFYEEEH